MGSLDSDIASQSRAGADGKAGKWRSAESAAMPCALPVPVYCYGAFVEEPR